MADHAWMRVFELVQRGQVAEFSDAWRTAGIGIDFAEACI